MRFCILLAALSAIARADLASPSKQPSLRACAREFERAKAELEQQEHRAGTAKITVGERSIEFSDPPQRRSARFGEITDVADFPWRRYDEPDEWHSLRRVAVGREGAAQTFGPLTAAMERFFARFRAALDVCFETMR